MRAMGARFHPLSADGHSRPESLARPFAHFLLAASRSLVTIPSRYGNHCAGLSSLRLIEPMHLLATTKTLDPRMNKRALLLKLLRAPAFFACLLFFTGNLRAESGTNAPVDLTELSIDKLMDIPIVTASKFEQKSAAAPASTTVITAE